MFVNFSKSKNIIAAVMRLAAPIPNVARPGIVNASGSFFKRILLSLVRNEINPFEMLKDDQVPIVRDETE